MANQHGLRSIDSISNMVKILSKQKNGLKICHINAQSLRNKIDEFRSIFENSNIDLISISETWLNSHVDDSLMSLNGYKLFRSDRGTHGGGVAVYVRSGISCKINCKSDSNDLIEFIFIELTNGKDKFLFGSVYRPNNNIDFNPFIEKLGILSSPFTRIVIAGDFNSNLLRDTRLIDSMTALGLSPVNTHMPTHFSATSSSLIDLFFVSSESQQIFYDQLSASCFSKHDLIYMVCDFFTHATPEKITFRDFRNIDFDLLRDEFMKIDWNIIYHLMSSDDQLIFLEDNINLLFEKSVCLRTRTLCTEGREWFTTDLNFFISKREMAYSRWKRFRTESLHDEYKAARRLANAKIREAKRKYYAIRFSNALDTKRTWKTIREIGIGKPRKQYMKETCDPDILNDKFVNINMTQADKTYYEELHDEHDPECLFNFRGITQDDVVSSILFISSNAVGSDNMHPKFFKILLPQLIPHVTFIFNKILTSSYFPSRWKQARIIPIPKSNSELRPIAILPFLSKAFERILHDQIYAFINSNNLLTSKQSGFRAKHSCLTALTDVVESIREEIDTGHIALLVLLDHSKAFDTVDHTILLQKLKKMMHFSTYAVNLIGSYLNGRSQYVDAQGKKSRSMMIEGGVPQGSILGPLLFSIYVNDLPTVLSKSKVRMYADDVQLYMSDDYGSISNCVANLNEELRAVYKWAKTNGLTLNPSKSKCLVIGKNRKPVNLMDNVLINGEQVEVVKTAKNLGVVFNCSLTWVDHINIACGKTFAMLRTLWSTQYCTPFRIRLLLAKTYLIPTLTYGCEIFASCDAKSKRKLNSTFNAITRYVFHLKKYDHISPFASKILGVKFEDFLKIRILIFFHKIIFYRYPDYLYNRINFSMSQRSRTVIQIRHVALVSERQFFINAIRLWNALPIQIRDNRNVAQFKCLVFDHYILNS